MHCQPGTVCMLIAVCQKARFICVVGKTDCVAEQKVIDHYENPQNVGSLDKKSFDVGTGLCVFAMLPFVCGACVPFLSVLVCFCGAHVRVWQFTAPLALIGCCGFSACQMPTMTG